MREHFFYTKAACFYTKIRSEFLFRIKPLSYKRYSIWYNSENAGLLKI